MLTLAVLLERWAGLVSVVVLVFTVVVNVGFFVNIHHPETLLAKMHMMTVLQFRFREQVILEFLRHLEDEICFEVLSKCLEHAQSLSKFCPAKLDDDMLVFEVEYFHITPYV